MGGLERAPHAPDALVPPRLSRTAPRSCWARSLERAPDAPRLLVPPGPGLAVSRSWLPGSPRHRAPGRPGMLRGEIPNEVRHFERRGGCLLSPVADGAAGAGPGLLLGIGRDDAE